MISHHHKCIFIHIPKTAGQSVEHCFIHALGLTWDTRAPLLLRHNDRTELGPPSLAHLKYAEYSKYKYITEEQLQTYFKFAFVRNPWSRLISIYKYMGHSKKMDFKSFLMKSFKNELWNNRYWFVCPQSEYVCDENGELILDFVGRFENLQDDFNYICTKIGLQETELPHVNKSEKTHNKDPKEITLKFLQKTLMPWQLYNSILHRYRIMTIPNFKLYKDYYDNESIEFVAELYRTDIELFGYKFNSNHIITTKHLAR